MRIDLTLAAGAALVAVACGPKFRTDDFPNPHALAEAAVTAANAGECGGAMPALRRVMFELPPRDTLVPMIRFAIGSCHLRTGEYLEGSRQYRRVADDFPTHGLAALSLVRSGDALAQLWRRPELDPTYGESAMATYREVLARFPSTAAADSARASLLRLSEMFAEKEFKNAEYYLRIRAYDSAISYFRSVVANYPQTSHAPLAMLKLIEIFDRLGFAEEREDACTYLRRFHPAEHGVGDACPA
ncbi:MAG: outer membrane protein assembly factor BamD [Gemmatimonadales bacterium]